ncbi:MAG: protein kinase [Clostridiales bacterium]|nr:protein kinase [Clostridiales bacterium]
MIGRTLNGRYRILNKVGSGGMADVYCALDTYEDRTVAVKVLKPEFSDDPQYLRRLTREAQAMVALENEHIVTLYDMGNEGDIHYLVLEYVNGETLRDRMDRVGRLPEAEAVSIMCDVLDGLSHAHKMGLIHRDVKPQNIMITEDGVIKLTDFGIAKFAGNATKTYDGKEAMGSVYYISPEQAKGEEVDAQTDLYSAGILLYEMLLGKPPFSGENAVQVALKHINDDIVPLHEADPAIPVAISDVVAKASSKERELRYTNADDMKNDLMRALRNPHSRFAKLHAGKSLHTALQEGGSEHKSKIREQLPHIAIVACVLGIIAVFAVMFILSMSDGREEYNRVPNFLGYTEEKARDYASNRGFKLLVIGYESSDEYDVGEICYQSPVAQTKAKPDSIVSVKISTGMETVLVPDLYGMTVDEAKKALEALGLVLDSNIEYQTGSEPVGTVIGQSANPNETLMRGDSVSITVCRESIFQTTRMPIVTGKDVSEAVKKLGDSKITHYRIKVVTESPDDKIYSNYQIVEQSPTGGMSIIADTVTVELTMFRDSLGEYKAEFSENVTLENETNTVVVTLQTDIGEIVLFESEYSQGTYSIPFTGRYWEQGSYTCVIYVNGQVHTSFNRNFE